MPETRIVTETVYTLAELKDGKHLEGQDVVESSIARGYDNAVEKLSMDAAEWMDGLDVVENEIAPLFAACGITFDAKEATWDTDRGSYFALGERGTRIDEKAFLRALKHYLAGKNVKLLAGWGGGSRAIQQVGTGIRNFDLRSKEARVIREQGLSVQSAGGPWHTRSDLDLDTYDSYEGVSDQTKADANELLSDLCDEALRILLDEYEYQTSEEAAMETAEANDYRFYADGSMAHTHTAAVVA